MNNSVSLKSYNSFGVQSYCPAIYFIRQESDLIPFYGKTPDQYFILGGGTNVLLSSELNKPVLKIEIKGIEIIHDVGEELILRIGAGENWHDLVMWCLDRQFYGLENLSLIPGTVGAAPIQNIGAYGVELESAYVRSEGVYLPDGKQLQINRDAAELAYRDSIFKKRWRGSLVITHVHLRLNRVPQIHVEYGDIKKILSEQNISEPTPKDVSNAVISIRKSKLPDPAELGNSGSFFKNIQIEASVAQDLKTKFPDMPLFPVHDDKFKIPSAWLIEQCGWKGYRKGDVGCHERQALVLVNYGNATGDEIKQLSEDIIHSVQQKFGLILEREVHWWA